MLLVVGLENCKSCTDTKELLGEKGIPFEYTLSKDLPKGDFKKYRFSALKKGLETMPILVEDGKVVTLEQVLEEFNGKND